MRTLREFRERLQQRTVDRELRQAPSRFGIALFDAIHEVPADASDALVPPGRHFLRRDVLAALEAAARALDAARAVLTVHAPPWSAVVVAASVSPSMRSTMSAARVTAAMNCADICLSSTPFGT